MNYQEVGKNISLYRKSKNLTQKALGKLIGKSESSIRKYEKGEIEIPNSVLDTLATKLNLNVSQLVSWDIESSINEMIYGYSRYKMDWIYDSTGYKMIVDPETELISFIDEKGTNIVINNDELDDIITEIESFMKFKFYSLKNNL